MQRKFMIFIFFIMLLPNAVIADERTRATVQRLVISLDDSRTGYSADVTLDFCTNGILDGAQGILWGERAIKRKREQICALSEADCNAFDWLWNGNSTPDSPRKPSFLVLYGVDEQKVSSTKLAKSKITRNTQSEAGVSLVQFSNHEMIAGTCGTNIHPEG